MRAHRHGWAQLGVLVVHLDESSGILGLLLVARGSSRVRVRWYLSVTRGNHASCGKGRAGVVNIAGLWIELGSREPQAPLTEAEAEALRLRAEAEG